MTVAEFLRHNRVNYADGNAVLFYERGESGLKGITYDEFYGEACRLAAGFSAHIGVGKRIGFVAEASWRYFLYICASILSGNVAVPINQTNPVKKIAELARLGDVTVICCDEEWEEDLRDVCSETRILSLPEMERLGMEAAGGYAPTSSKPEDIALILFSSGTTGATKAVPIRNESLTVYSLELERLGDMGRGAGEASVIQFLPFYHIGGVLLTMEAITYGEAVYVGSLKYMLKDMAELTFSRMIASPAMAERVLAAAEKKERIRENMNALREILCVGAPFKESVLKSMEKYGITPRMYYGLTETAGVVSGIGKYKKDACGKIPEYSKVRIKDGEILVKGVNVFEGYYNNPEMNSHCFDDGWFCTGDLGEIDEEGYLFIKGRIKNTIILSNGENVCPEELEEMLYQNLLVKECMVYGKDEEICADVWLGETPRDGACEAVTEHLNKVNMELPLAHRIKRLNFTENELPKNATGKLLRHG